MLSHAPVLLKIKALPPPSEMLKSLVQRFPPEQDIRPPQAIAICLQSSSRFLMIFRIRHGILRAHGSSYLSPPFYVLVVAASVPPLVLQWNHFLLHSQNGSFLSPAVITRPESSNLRAPVRSFPGLRQWMVFLMTFTFRPLLP